MPEHAFTDIRDIAPKAWDAICELAGGEDRVSEKSKMWSHGFIVNLGTVEGEGKVIGPKELDNWHVDGDFFGACRGLTGSGEYVADGDDSTLSGFP